MLLLGREKSLRHCTPGHISVQLGDFQAERIAPMKSGPAGSSRDALGRRGVCLFPGGPSLRLFGCAPCCGNELAGSRSPWSLRSKCAQSSWRLQGWACLAMTL